MFCETEKMTFLKNIKMLFSTKSTSKFDVLLNVIYLLSLYLTLLSIPLFSFNTKYLFFTWIFSFALVVSMVLKIFFLKKIKINLTYLLGLILLVVSMLFSSLLNFNGAFTFTPFILLAIIFTAFIFYLTFVDIKYFSFRVLYLSLISFLLFYIVIYRSELLTHDFYRLGTAFGDQNEIAMFLSLGACFSLYYILFDSKIIFKILYFAFLALFIYCGFSTGSKLFLLTFAGCAIFMIFFFFRRKWWIALLSLLGVIVIAIIILNLPAFDSYKMRVVSFFNFFSPKNSETTDFSTYERYEMFIGALHMFLTKPIFGFGTLGFAQLSSFGRGCHNTFAQMLCNYGIIGFLLFFYPFVKSFYIFFKKKKDGLAVQSMVVVIFFLLCALSLYLDIQKIYAFVIPLVYASLFENEQDNYLLNLNGCERIINITSKIFRNKKMHSSSIKSNKVKICFLVSNFGLGGPQELVKNLTLNLDTSIFDIHVISLFNIKNNKYKEYINSNNLKIHFYFLDKKSGHISLNFFLRFKELLDHIKPDVCSTHTSALFYTYLATLFRKVKIIHTIHSLPNLDQKSIIRKCLSRSIKKKKITLVGCSNEIAISASKIYKTEVPFINNGIEIKEITKSNYVYDFFTLCRLVKMKNVDKVLDALNGINKNESKYSLAIIGDGPACMELKAKVRKENIRNVFFLGERDDVYEIIRQSKVHVLASEWEGNPISVLESMNCGVPSIAPIVGGIPDIIKDHYNGLLFLKGDYGQLQELMLESLKHNLYEEMSLNCKKEIIKYDIKKTADEYSKLFLNKGER